MCEAKPGTRCAGDTSGAAADTAAAYAAAYPDGPDVNPLNGAQAAFLPRPVTKETHDALKWHEDHSFDSMFRARGATPAEFVQNANEIDLFTQAIGNPHPDPARVRDTARLVVAGAKYDRGTLIDEAGRARLERATDVDYDRALDAYRERMLGEPVEASTEIMTNRLSEVLAERELAGKYRTAEPVERTLYQRYVLDQADTRFRGAADGRALLAVTSTIEGEPINYDDDIAIEAASDAQITDAMREAIAFTRAQRNGEFATADQFGDTLAGFVRDKVRDDEAAQWRRQYAAAGGAASHPTRESLIDAYESSDPKLRALLDAVDNA